MPYFAQVDIENTVQQVLSIDQAELNTGLWGDPAQWFQTSYNTSGGVYYTPNTNTPAPDQSKAFRKNYAGIGFLWLPNGPEGEGFAPPKPYPSWLLNSFSYLWEAPVPMPEGQGECSWDETTLEWVCGAPVTIPVYPE
jgi:hypothetical protein